MNILRIGLMSAALVAGLASADAQVVAADSVMQHVNGKRLSIGGYGEVAFSRNFYSDSGNRYSSASLHKNDPSHGRFDIPHAVIYLGYDFGKGWTFGTEIEFEHGGTGGLHFLEDYYIIPIVANEVAKTKHKGLSPNGKATDSDSVSSRFESL